MSKGLKISKPGFDVDTAAPKDLIMSTQFDMFKIARTGTLYIDIPEETKGDGAASSTYTTTYSHGLGYTPLLIPDAQNVLTDVVVAFGGGDDTILNDAANDAFIMASGPPTTSEIATLHANSTQVVLTVTRNWDYAGTFAAHRVTCYYTIFYNKLGETFNLL